MSGKHSCDKYSDILFRSTTSHNAKKEIFEAFGMCKATLEPEKLCSFYQGCGCDIITIEQNKIGTHIFSDRDSSYRESISQKLQELQSGGYIFHLSGDDCSWRFIRNNQHKRLIFTTKSIDEVDFKSMYRVSLFLVFEYNPGDSARKKAFWQAIQKQMVPGGYVVGSYASTTEFAGREAFLFHDCKGDVCLCGDEDYSQEINAANKENLVEYAKNSDVFLDTVPGSTIAEFDGQLYHLYRVTNEKTHISKLWSEPMKTFGLKFLWKGELICILQKSASNERV